MTTLVELYCMESSGWSALIIPCQTGIVWSNQVGGTACGHPEMEGILLPLSGHHEVVDRLPSGRLIMENQCHEVYDAGVVSALLSSMRLDDLLEPLPVDKQTGEFAKMSEAWVPVRIRDEKFYDVHLVPFVGRVCILTYPNSD